MYAVVGFGEQLVFQILALSPEMETVLIQADPKISDFMGMRHDCRRPNQLDKNPK